MRPRESDRDKIPLSDQPTHPLDDGALTIAAACQLLSIGRTSLWHAMRCGELPYFQIGRSVRIARRSLLAWMATKPARRLVGSTECVMWCRSATDFSDWTYEAMQQQCCNVRAKRRCRLMTTEPIKDRGGAPVGNTHALTAGVWTFLRTGRLPKKRAYTKRQLTKFDRVIGAAIVEKHGEISLVNMARKQSVLRHEGRAQLLGHYLREHEHELSLAERMTLLREISQATEARDKHWPLSTSTSLVTRTHGRPLMQPLPRRSSRVLAHLRLPAGSIRQRKAWTDDSTNADRHSGDAP